MGTARFASHPLARKSPVYARRWTRPALLIALAHLAIACSSDPTEPADSGVDVPDAGSGDASADASQGGPDADGSADADAGPLTDGSGEQDGSTEPVDVGPQPRPYPEPGAFPPHEGPGIGRVTYTEEQLYQNCAYLDGGPDDFADHHNLVIMYRGFLLMPWSPEFGSGGISLFDISDPCNPVEHGSGFSPTMRESHALGFMEQDGRHWMAVNNFEGIFDGGIEFWDVTDLTAPTPVSYIHLPGFAYPDAYAKVTLSLFWQAPYVYVSGSDNGVYVIDAADPENPVLVSQYVFDPVLRVGQVQVIGNLLVATAAEGARTALMDVSDPGNLVPIPGGDFLGVDENGEPKEAYFTNTSGGYVWYARKQGGGGPMVMDIRDPSNPVYAGSLRTEGNGGYIAIHEDYAFIGESNFAQIYNISDLSNITIEARLDLEGDLDTMYPIGHLAVLSVDDKAVFNQATSIAPWRTEPDSNPPVVNFAWPPDGATDLALTSRFGVTFNEMVDITSAWEGSVRLYITGTDPAMTRVDGTISVGEAIVNFWPDEPLLPSTSYTLEIPAGGIEDFAGNAIEEPFTATFTTGEF